MYDMPEDLQLFFDAERLVCRLHDLRYTDYSRFKTDRVQRLLMLANRRADRRFFLFDIPSHEYWHSSFGMPVENRPVYTDFDLIPKGKGDAHSRASILRAQICARFEYANNLLDIPQYWRCIDGVAYIADEHNGVKRWQPISFLSTFLLNLKRQYIVDSAYLSALYDDFSVSPSGTAAENRPVAPDLTPKGEGVNYLGFHELPF